MPEPAAVESGTGAKVPSVVESSGGRDNQREEKFRSIFMRYNERSNLFPMYVEHTRGSSRPGG